MGPELLFHKPTAIAIAGAVIQPFINGEPSFINKVLKIHAGDSLTFGKIVKGARFYIAVRGGFLGDQIMNSQSTCITSSILSLLTKRDRITYADYDGYFEQPPLFLRNVGKKTIELQKGPEYQMLEDTTPNLKQLFQALFTVMPESNRMAYRVRHDVDLKHKISIISSATMPGTVQLTPGGDLIFLMKDAQTTGGYPRVFQLTEQGICDLAQMKPGEQCRVVERAF